jgi:hypothetical protein
MDERLVAHQPRIFLEAACYRWDAQQPDKQGLPSVECLRGYGTPSF